jgi:hypothetical protein
MAALASSRRSWVTNAALCQRCQCSSRNNGVDIVLVLFLCAEMHIFPPCPDATSPPFHRDPVAVIFSA